MVSPVVGPPYTQGQDFTNLMINTMLGCYHVKNISGSMVLEMIFLKKKKSF
jgi:hypothetical protein